MAYTLIEAKDGPDRALHDPASSTGITAEADPASESEIRPWACKVCGLWIHSHWADEQRHPRRVEIATTHLVALGLTIKCPLPTCDFEYYRDHPAAICMHFEAVHNMHGADQPYILQPDAKDFEGRKLSDVKMAFDRCLWDEWSRQRGMLIATTLDALEGRFCVCVAGGRERGR